MRWPVPFMVVLSFLILVSPGLQVVPGHGSVGETTPADQIAVVAAADYAYRNYSEVRARMLQIESQYPAIAKVLDIGDSWEKTQGIANRDILALKISDNVTVDEDEPEVLIVALHHAREWITSEIAVALAERLTLGYGTDPRVSWLVDNREVWIIPVVNPDGLDYALGTDAMWRKNRRLNADLTYGVDLNRNYNGSSNGDPLGAWGGVGSSGNTWDDVYRGTAPFSEPETQAVRDIVMNHSFTLGIDFHSWGNLVLWPWGYTTNETPDHVALSRIGSELAAVNGYIPQQSVGLYPTTGDSSDWMYGSAGIYAYTIEVGDEFHPINSSTAGHSIAENVDAAVLGIEIAGDRAEKGFSISHAPRMAANYSEVGHVVTANVTAERGVNSTSVALHYSLDGANWTEVPMVKSSGNDTYSGFIPSVPVWQTVEYYFSATDDGGVRKVAPQYAPYATYSLVITPPPGLLGGVNFSLPAVMDGSIENAFNASVVGYPDSFWLELELNSTEEELNYIWRWESGTGNLTCELGAGIPLGDYTARLVASVGGFDIWNSSESHVVVADLTAPAFSSVDGAFSVGDTGRRFIVNIQCSDLYGVERLVLKYRINDGQETSLTHDTGVSQTNPYSWRWILPIPDEEGYLEYNLSAFDSSNIARYPANGSWIRADFAHVSSEPGSRVLYLAFAATAVAAAVVVALLFIRARRRRASGLEDIRSRSRPKKP